MNQEGLPWEGVKARGLTLIQFKKYLFRTLGRKEGEQALDTLPQASAEAVRNAKKSSWYPFEIQRQLREVIIDAIDPSDPGGVMYRMGLETASWDFSTFLKPLFSFISVEMILNRVSSLWHKYYDQGEVRVTSFKPGDAVIELYDLPYDPYFCPLVTSWLMVALNTLKKNNPDVQKSEIVLQGKKICRFKLRWEES